MSVSVDLSKAFLHRQHGDLVMILTWMNDERAMILVPAFRQGAPWFVVMESASYSWDDEDQKNIPEVVRKSTKACEVLGIEATPHNCRRIAGIIIDSLPDLIRMPSSPPQEFHNESYGKLTLKADGQVMAQEDIRVEKEGARYG